MRLRLTTTAFLLLAALAMPAVARADCQPVESVVAALESAEVAFVGTVAAVSEVRSSATFRVEETWTGTIGQRIEVFGLNGGRGISEDDRTWHPGQRYLVLPYRIGAQLVDQICSGTRPWSNELAALRPPTATVAEPEPAPTTAPPWPVIVAGALVLVLTLAGWLAFRRSDAAR